MIQKYTVTAQGEGRLDIVGRISMLFLQRHIDVESLTYMSMGEGGAEYKVCAVAQEDTIRKVVAQMRHVDGLKEISYA